MDDRLGRIPRNMKGPVACLAGQWRATKTRLTVFTNSNAAHQRPTDVSSIKTQPPAKKKKKEREKKKESTLEGLKIKWKEAKV
jgi:hypothetical protein